MHKSLCVDCGHEKILHTDLEKPDKLGECCAVGGYCQCTQFVRSEAEENQIVDVGSEEDRASAASADWRELSNVGVYDASTDTIVSENFRGEERRILMNEKTQAEETMQKATDILDRNTETLTPEQLNLDRISIPEGSRLLAKNQPADSNLKNGVYIAGQGHVSQESLDSMRPAGRDVNNGDVWQPQPGVVLLWLNGHWLTPEEFNTARIIRENQKQEDDPVNHPSHYTAYPGVEVIQLTRWMSFNLGNAVKYIARAGLKDSDKEIQDLKKSIWYIKDEIARKKGEYGTMQE